MSWSNKFPVWAICGSYYRSQLEQGAMVFFMPKKKSIRKAGLKDYICTGILVVNDKIEDSKKVMTDKRLDEKYKQQYLADLNEHLKDDKSKTAKIRSKNFIFGDKSESKWFGKNTRYLRPILESLNLHDIAEKLSLRRIPSLEKEEAKGLYNALKSTR